MATVRKRWPDGAEKQRKDAIAAALQIRKLARRIRTQARLDPQLVEMIAADIEIEAANIQIALDRARHNPYDEEEDV